jgi:hypothetical protein
MMKKKICSKSLKTCFFCVLLLLFFFPLTFSVRLAQSIWARRHWFPGAVMWPTAVDIVLRAWWPWGVRSLARRPLYCLCISQWAYFVRLIKSPTSLCNLFYFSVLTSAVAHSTSSLIIKECLLIFTLTAICKLHNVKMNMQD